MQEQDLITGLQNYFSSRLSVPVKTSGLEDERPVPLLLIEDWDTNDKNLHNSPYSGEATGDFTNDGTIQHERYLTFDWETRVEFLVRTADEVETSSLKDRVKDELRPLREYPELLNSELKRVEPASGGNPTYTFTEQKEAELMLSARFHGDHTITLTPADTPSDVLRQVNSNFTFNP